MISILEKDVKPKHIQILDNAEINKKDNLLLLEGIDNDSRIYEIIISDYTLEQIFRLLIKRGMQ